VATNAQRARILERALEATVAGDSRPVKDLFTDDVDGRWPANGPLPGLHVSSAVELAFELECWGDACSDVVLDVRSLDVGDDRACLEWSAIVTHSGVLVVDEVVIEPSGKRWSVEGVVVADFDGARIRSFRYYWDEARSVA